MNTNNDNSIEDKEFGAIITSSTKITSHTYRVYLTDSIEDFDTYHQLLAILDSAKIQDKVIITLQNFGGSCHSCLALINAVRHSKAMVVAKVIGPCYSAGTTLALACDSLELFPHTFLHFHDYSSVFVGKSAEVAKEIKENDRWIHGYMNDFHKPFLTDREYDAVLNGKELYIHVSDRNVQKRLQRHFEHREATTT